MKTEKQIWKIVLDVVRGQKASDCLASFAEYWLNGPAKEKGYALAAGWFATGGPKSGRLYVIAFKISTD